MPIRLPASLSVVLSTATVVAAPLQHIAIWRRNHAGPECSSHLWVGLHHVIWIHTFGGEGEDDSPAWAVPAELTKPPERQVAVDWSRENLEDRVFGCDHMM